VLVSIDQIKVNDRIRKEFGDIQILADDIKENGLINPPVVTPDYELIAGERRLRACELLGYQQIEVRVMTVRDFEHQLHLEISENEKRKNFTFSEGIEWAKRLEQVEALKAKERMVNPVQTFAEGETGRTRDKVASDAGFGSGETYRKAKFIADNADAGTIEELDKGQTTINKAYQQLKERLQETELERDAAQKAVDAYAEQTATLWKENKALKSRKPEVVEKTVEVVPGDYQQVMEKNQEMNTRIAQLSGEMDTIRREYDAKLRDVQDGDVKANKRELQRLLSEQLKALDWNHSSALFLFQRLNGNAEAARSDHSFMSEYQEAVKRQLSDWQNAITLQTGDEETWQTI